MENWTWYNLWNLLDVNLKDKSNHNSIEWSGFIFKWISHRIGKLFRFTLSRLLENPPPKIFLEKIPQYFRIWRHLDFSLLNLEPQIQKPWMAPRSTYLFTLPRSIERLPGTPGDLRLEVNSPLSGSAKLRLLNRIHKKES